MGIENYSFTFEIPFNKVIYFRGRRPFGSLTFENQYNFLEDHLQKINKFKNIMWVYELHKVNPRLHIHGYIINSTFDEVQSFRHDFYISQKIGISARTYIQISDIQLTLIDKHYFIDYMDKNQHEIIYKMRVLEDKFNSDALDGKKFKVSIHSNINPQYFKSLEEGQEERQWGDKYLFGVTNKFIVEI